MVARPRVGFLTYGLDRPLTGVTRVVTELGRALRAGGECDLVFLNTFRSGPFWDDPSTAYYLPGCSRLPGLMALGGPLIALAARRLRLDVVHDPTGISPFTVGRWAGRFKRVAGVYDAIAFRYPEGYPWLNNLLHRRFVPATLPNVDAITTLSQFSKDDAERFLGLPRDRVHVVYLAADERFRPAPPDAVRAAVERHGITPPYVLSVGAQQARKNLPMLVSAFAEVRVQVPDHQLVIAGPHLWRYDALQRQIAGGMPAEAVKTLGFVSDDDLVALYSGASAFVFPSLYEGFGLPVLEAMACGAPVACSNTTSLPEVAGDAALLFDPADRAALGAAIVRILRDPELAASLRERGLARAARFTWAEVARQTAVVYRSVLATDRS